MSSLSKDVVQTPHFLDVIGAPVKQDRLFSNNPVRENGAVPPFSCYPTQEITKFVFLTYTDFPRQVETKQDRSIR